MYRVCAETLEGKTVILRKGFASREDAEDHPVKLSSWHCVWIEQEPGEAPRDDEIPAFPWTMRSAHGNLVYLVGADGKCFATLLGSAAKTQKTARLILDAIGQGVR